MPEGKLRVHEVDFLNINCKTQQNSWKTDQTLIIICFTLQMWKWGESSYSGQVCFQLSFSHVMTLSSRCINCWYIK